MIRLNHIWPGLEHPYSDKGLISELYLVLC